MKVVLVQDVPKLGKAGDVKDVTQGYGFNFLLPQGFAELASEGALKRVALMKAHREKEKSQKLSEVQSLANAVSNRTVTVHVKVDENGKVFGSVNAKDIALAMREEGVEIEENMIALAKPIRAIGSHELMANIGEGITANFEVLVRGK